MSIAATSYRRWPRLIEIRLVSSLRATAPHMGHQRNRYATCSRRKRVHAPRPRLGERRRARGGAHEMPPSQPRRLRALGTTGDSIDVSVLRRRNIALRTGSVAPDGRCLPLDSSARRCSGGRCCTSTPTPVIREDGHSGDGASGPVSRALISAIGDGVITSPECRPDDLPRKVSHRCRSPVSVELSRVDSLPPGGPLCYRLY
jgi:hypothetical protein